MAVLIIMIAVIWFAVDPPEPKLCRLCDFIKSHAPCLLNIATGEIGELALYEPHPALVGELAEVQRGGTLCFFYAADCKVTKLTDPWELAVDVPAGESWVCASLFCRECREMLKGQREGYLLVDLYHERPVLYPISDGARYQIRCYSITVEEKDSGEKITIKLTGTLDQGSA